MFSGEEVGGMCAQGSQMDVDVEALLLDLVYWCFLVRAKG